VRMLDGRIVSASPGTSSETDAGIPVEAR
jgi:hypothetical protein